MKALVVGGGFYGARLALLLRRCGAQVVLCEGEPALLTRASYVNQARVHAGYHYPRSLLTSMRSQVNYQRFCTDYVPAIHSGFRQLYAIARHLSKVSARQFAAHARRIGAPIDRASAADRGLFDAARVEEVFVVEEVAFDANVLASLAGQELAAQAVEVRLDTAVRTIRRAHGSGYTVEVIGPGGVESLLVDIILNCTYASLNGVLRSAGAPAIPLTHEVAEIVVVDPPPALRGVGVTVMDGPFFSLMPFPARSLHSLTHVRYTPRATWHEGAAVAAGHTGIPRPQGFQSAAVAMIADARRYLPAIAEATIVASLMEVKTVLPESEVDDSRPILLHESTGFPGLISVLGAKIDSVYDVEDRLMPWLVGQGCSDD